MKGAHAVLFLAAALMVAVSSCSRESDRDQEPAAEQTEARASEQGEATPGAEDSPSGDDSAGVSASKSTTIGDFELEWKVDGDSVAFAVSAPTAGWVAVGFEPDRMMMGANLIIGYVADGVAEVTDQWGTSTVTHGLDIENGGTDDLSNIGGNESDGRTRIEFTIPLDSGDSTDKPLSVGQELSVILAYGNRDDLQSYHVHRTSTRITL